MRFFDAFLFSNLIKGKELSIYFFFLTFCCLKQPLELKIFQKEMFAKWTRDGVQNQFNRNWSDRQKWGFSGLHRIESVQDFFDQLGHETMYASSGNMHFSLNLVIVRLAKIMNRGNKNWTQFREIKCLTNQIFQKKILI